MIDVAKLCSLCGVPYMNVSEGHNYVECVQSLYRREKTLNATLKQNGSAIMEALKLRDKQVNGEINSKFNFKDPVC